MRDEGGERYGRGEMRQGRDEAGERYERKGLNIDHAPLHKSVYMREWKYYGRGERYEGGKDMREGRDMRGERYERGEI